MTIGRNVESSGLAIFEHSVSRRHAELVRDGETWSVRDLGSVNGTFVDDLRIEHAVSIRNTARLCFGRVALYFLMDASSLPHVQRSRAISDTAPPTLDQKLPRATTSQIAPPILELASFEIQMPTGGGVGYLTVEGKRLQLTNVQLELITTLVSRMTAEEDKDDDARGFVHGRELMKLSLDSPRPTEDNVRHLVGRVRRALIKAGIGDLIESRYGLGYRLRVIPKLSDGKKP